MKLRPGPALAGWKDLAVWINGRPDAWEECLRGVALDILPPMLEVAVEGTTPGGRRQTAHFMLNLVAPELAAHV